MFIISNVIVPIYNHLQISIDFQVHYIITTGMGVFVLSGGIVYLLKKIPVINYIVP